MHALRLIVIGQIILIYFVTIIFRDKIQMSSPSNPPKLNYAKGRNKSKNKYQSVSQQKIIFDGQSSTDIFAHLNQDNLNYIKKQLKNKKSSNSHERAKSTNVQATGEKIQTKSTKQQQQKVYQKYKNQNQVIERDPREEQTLRQTQVDQNEMFVNQSRQKQISSDQNLQDSKHEEDKYMGLKPPPSTRTQNHQKIKKYKQSLPSTESQHIKTASLEMHHLEPKINDDFRNQGQYQLTSQQSKNQNRMKSYASVQNHLSQLNSTYVKPSQFIDFLQVYIQELNQQNQLSKNSLSKRSLRRGYDFQDSNRIDFSNGQFDSMRRYAKKKTQEQQNINKQTKKQNQKYLSYRQRRPQQLIIQKQPTNEYYIQMEQQSFGNSSIKKAKREILYKGSSPEFQSPQNYTMIIKQLKNQLSQQKLYCTSLASELHKYKTQQEFHKREFKNMRKAIQLLGQETKLLKEEIESQKYKEKKMMKEVESAKYQSQPSCPTCHLSNKTKNKTKQFEFQHNSLYDDINPRFYKKVKDSFQAGRQQYLREKESISSRYKLSKQQPYFPQNNDYPLEIHNKQFIRPVVIQSRYNRNEKQNNTRSKVSSFRQTPERYNQNQNLRSSLEKLKEDYLQFKFSIKKQKPDLQSSRKFINTNF